MTPDAPLAEYANLIAKQLGLGDTTRRVLEDAALIADGQPYLRRIEDFPAVMEVVLFAGERWDGGERAFPGVLAGEEIPIESRILAVSRRLAAIASGSDRLDLGHALVDIRVRAGAELDPAVVAAAAEVVKITLEPAEDKLQAA